MAEGRTRSRSAVNAAFAYTGAIVAQTGVQMIAPSLPSMRDALGLSDAQLALVTSVYLLPGALAAIPAGILADRIGRRRVFGGAMIAFGLLGAALQFATSSFSLFLVIRFLQGIAFAGLLPLTMTILGDAFSGSELVRAQGRRSVAMAIGDGSLPVIGGILVAAGWFVPWASQALAIPFGILVLTKLTDPPRVGASSTRRIDLGAFGRLFRSAPVVALEYAGFLRMFLKFSILTFLPILMVDGRGFSAAFAGLVVGAAAITGTVIAATAGRIARLGRPTTWVAIGIVLQSAALAAMVLVPWSAVIFSASLVYGAADGLSGVFVNSFVTAATDAEHRAGFVAATGAIRNFAKFMAPATFGALTLMLSVPSAFGLLAGITLVSTALVVPLRGMEGRLTDEAPAS